MSKHQMISRIIPVTRKPRVRKVGEPFIQALKASILAEGDAIHAEMQKIAAFDPLAWMDACSAAAEEELRWEGVDVPESGWPIKLPRDASPTAQRALRIIMQRWVIKTWFASDAPESKLWAVDAAFRFSALVTLAESAKIRALGITLDQFRNWKKPSPETKAEAEQKYAQYRAEHPKATHSEALEHVGAECHRHRTTIGRWIGSSSK
jgi:hypothetical protein